MTHTVKEHDGMKVLVVSDMNRVYDDEGNLKSVKEMGGTEIVHASEIARYYGIPLRSIGRGDNEVRGIWAMVFDNEMGQRVPYNTEETKRGDRLVRNWKITKDANGDPRSTEETIVKTTTHWDAGKQGQGFLTRDPIVDEIDDGLYVRLEDVLMFAEAQGWTKGGGRPGTHTARQVASSEEKIDKMAEAITALTKLVASTVVVKKNDRQPV